VCGLATSQPAQWIGRPTIGDVVRNDIRNMLVAQQEAVKARAEFNAAIARARDEFFANLSDPARRSAAEKRFADMLFGKDIHHATLLIGEGLNDQARGRARAMDTMTGGKVDNGIPHTAEVPFEAWVRAVRHHLGARGDNDLLVVTDPGRLAAALEASADWYAYYKAHRDRAEIAIRLGESAAARAMPELPAAPPPLQARPVVPDEPPLQRARDALAQRSFIVKGRMRGGVDYEGRAVFTLREDGRYDMLHLGYAGKQVQRIGTLAGDKLYFVFRDSVAVFHFPEKGYVTSNWAGGMVTEILLPNPKADEEAAAMEASRTRIEADQARQQAAREQARERHAAGAQRRTEQQQRHCDLVRASLAQHQEQLDKRGPNPVIERQIALKQAQLERPPCSAQASGTGSIPTR
jgi:hypothetical protein